METAEISKRTMLEALKPRPAGDAEWLAVELLSARPEIVCETITRRGDGIITFFERNGARYRLQLDRMRKETP